MSKKKKDIIVTFMGEARNDVTGSSVNLNIPRKDGTRYNVLIEMGLVQGGSTIEKDLANNRRMLERYSKDYIKTIDTVFISHEHSDHLTNLPYLTANGFEGRVIMPKQSVPIAKHLMEDSVKIHLSNIQRLKDTKGKRVKEFYNLQDMYNLFEMFEYRPVGEKFRLNDEIEFRFINSGHVLGGAMLELWIKKPNNSIKKIVYTSDMGSDFNNEFQYFVPLREQISKCNLLISEATYNTADRSWTRKDAIAERRELKKEIKEHLSNGKEVLFSTFSFSRCQNILCMLYDFFSEEDWFKYEVILDGVLLHKINDDYLKVLEGEELEYFKKVLKWKNLKSNKTFEGTKAILSKRTPRIIISTSGFLLNGRIVTYLQHLLGSIKTVFYLTGYCGGEDSLGARILDSKQKTVTIDKKVILKKATVKQLKTFSSHIQYKELISLFRGVDCDKILIHHSSSKDKAEFGQSIREEINKVGKPTKVEVVTDKNNQFIL